MKLPPLAVLIPYSKGIFVYVQTASQELHYVLSTHNRREILEQLDPLPPPRLVAFLGNAPWTALAELLLEQTDLCLIPDPWLKHIPRHQPKRRAEFALQLLEAYLEDPIRLLGAKDPESISNSTLIERTNSWTTLLKRS
jgi:hypothetical protein